MATEVRSGRASGGPAAPAAVRSSTHHLAVLLAAALAILLSATVLSALAALADRSVQSAVQRRLASGVDIGIDVVGRYRAQDLDGGGKAARAALDHAFGEVPHRTYSALRAPASLSSEYSVIRADGTLSGASSVVVALPDPAAHAGLTAGAWPRAAAGGPVQAALSQSAAARVGLRVGDTFQVQVGLHRVPMRLTGTYTPAPDDPGVLAGLTSAYGGPDSFALVAPGAFTAQPALAADAVAAWIGTPDTSRLSLGEIGPLRDRAAALSGSDAALSVFHGRPPAMSNVYAFSNLPETLAALSAPMAVARAGMDIPAVLLAALATAALMLTARQFAQARAVEVALKGARGAGTGRLVGAAAGQWALVAVPAAVAAPFLAGPLLAGLRRAGLLHGDLPASGVTAVGWTAALLALALHGLSVLLPTARAAADRRAGMRLRLRGARAAAFQRAGTDVALAVIAAAGWLELRHYRTPVVGGGVSGTSVDPVLVLTPVAMTAAATLLSLRLLPLAAPFIDRAARRAAGFVLPLGGWQVGRRAARHTGPALLMTLALAVGALGVTALAILDRGATDQAAFSVGGDLRITPPQQTIGHVPPSGQRHDVYAGLPGVTALTPVTDVPLSRGGQVLTAQGVNTAAILATQTSGAGGPVPAIRSDLTDRPAADLLGALGAKVPEHGYLLPGRPTALPLTVRLSADGKGPYVPVALTVTVEDADGLPSELTTSLPVTDGTPYTVRMPLGFTGRAPAARHYPLRVIGLAVSIRFPFERRMYHLRIDSDAAPNGGVWRDLSNPDFNDGGCNPRSPRPEVKGPHLCTLERVPGALFAGTFRGPMTGVVPPLWDMALGPVPPRDRPPVPALADATLQATGEFRTGSVVALDGGPGIVVKVKVIGRITAVPGVDRSIGRLLVDSRALAAAVLATGNAPPADDFWLLSTRHGDATAAAAVLRADPAAGAGTTVPQAARQIRDDPLQHGTRTALVLALALAPAFAVIGFTLHTAMSARSRRGEFALLRAIGVRRRQLAALLWVEQLGLALLAVVVGSALGAFLAAVITPLVSVDATGAPIVPVVAVAVPWLKVAAVALGTALLIVAVVTALARVFARVDLVRVLRAGDDG